MTLLAAFCIAVSQQPVEVPTSVMMSAEPALQTTVSPSMRLVSVRNAWEQLAKDSGAIVSVQPTVAELKVALLVNDRSVGWALDKIADVLDLEWKKEGERYRLLQSPAAASAY